MLRERERASSDLLIGLLDFLRLEGRSPVQHRVEDDSDRPVIDLITVAATGLQDLGSQVVWRSANGALFLTLVKNLRSEAEISHLELHFVGEEQIAQLQVSMNHLARMNVLHGEHELVDVVASFNLMKALTTLDKIGEGLVAANVEHDIDIFFVLEVAIEANDALMVQRAMNLDLTGQLLAGFSPGQIGLGDHLEGPGERRVFDCLDRLDPTDFVALGEAALAEEAQSLVSDDLAWFVVVLRIHRLYFLFDDL